MIEQRYMQSPRTAHAVFTELYGIAKEKTSTGAAYLLQLVSMNPKKRHQMRKAFHGPVLRDISEQVWIKQPDGTSVRYTKAAWKELFRDWFIPPEPQEYVVKATSEVKVRMVKRSTEDLNDDEFQEFLLQVQAFATVDLGVEFQEQDQ